MPLLYFLADAFTRTFGITQPSEAQRTRAALFILGLTLVMIAGLLVVALFLRRLLG